MSSEAPSFVSSVLKEYSDVTRDLLFRYLPNDEPREYLYDLLADYPRRGGRGFRPSLTIATARAFGAPLDAALHTAVSIEMMHNAMLIHDDIEDESEERRGKPTMHVTEGVPIAINVGDTLAMMAMRPLLDNREKLGAEMSVTILKETERMSRESAEGQALELGWRRDNVTDVTEADYLFMILKKTCWLATIHPSRMGALIGARGRFNLDRCIRFGYFLGAAFQIQDDILNLEGDAQAYGKEIGGDIWEGKRTLMLIHLLTNATEEENQRIRRLLGESRSEHAEADMAWIRQLMDQYNSIEYAREVAQGLAGVAQFECNKLYGHLPDSHDKRFLQDLPTWVIERN